MGWTFISGAREAWIADEVGEARAGQAFLRGAQAGQIGSLAGIPLSVVLASQQLNLPILLGGALFLALSLFLLVAMPETGFTPAPRAERGSWRAMQRTLREGVGLDRLCPVFLIMLAIAALTGMASEGFDRLWTPHLLHDFSFPDLGGIVPVVWFGLLRFGAILLSLAVTEGARRRLDTGDNAAVARAALAGSMVAFGLAGNFALALAAYLSVAALDRVRAPLWQAWINQQVEAKVRATVFSISSQANALGQIAAGRSWARSR